MVASTQAGVVAVQLLLLSVPEFVLLVVPHGFGPILRSVLARLCGGHLASMPRRPVEILSPSSSSAAGLRNRLRRHVISLSSMRLQRPGGFLVGPPETSLTGLWLRLGVTGPRALVFGLGSLVPTQPPLVHYLLGYLQPHSALRDGLSPKLRCSLLLTASRAALLLVMIRILLSFGLFRNNRILHYYYMLLEMTPIGPSRSFLTALRLIYYVSCPRLVFLRGPPVPFHVLLRLSRIYLLSSSRSAGLILAYTHVLKWGARAGVAFLPLVYYHHAPRGVQLPVPSRE